MHCPASPTEGPPCPRYPSAFSTAPRPPGPQVSHYQDLDRFVQIGSLTKPLTGTLLAQLTEAGVLQLDDPLDRFLHIPAGTGITLRHIHSRSPAALRSSRLRRWWRTVCQGECRV
ncbi:serine hydrolase [Streptomyces sp. NPDC015032]|uniref:serine hydrolase n=1 Tax=Streptomyces sp. NPDC015032 TaxID=3364937 RepID=UPI0036FC5325